MCQELAELAAWAEIYANPEFHRQMAEVARDPHSSIPDQELYREIKRLRRPVGRLSHAGDRLNAVS